jgi:endonuclease V-like protein UPF0215 family
VNRVALRPHVLAVDDAPFEKRQAAPVPIVAVMMEGADLVECVALAEFAVDGDDATGFLSGWLGRLRALASAQAVLLGGITIAGLGVVDAAALASALAKPVLVVTRKEPDDHQLAAALGAAGLTHRVPIVERSPRARHVDDGLFVAQAGTGPEEAAQLVRATRRKANLPEPLRVAHMIGRALVLGESRGRV